MAEKKVTARLLAVVLPNGSWNVCGSSGARTVTDNVFHLIGYQAGEPGARVSVITVQLPAPEVVEGEVRDG